MISSNKILIIYNPVAGPKRQKFFDEVFNRLSLSSYEITLLKTKYPGHAQKIAQKHKNGPYIKIIVAGGDGTINEVITGLYPSSLPLGIIPLGTANVLAREIYSNFSIDEIASAILGNVQKSCWLGKTDQHFFSLMVSAGTDALAVVNVNLFLKKYFGKAAYVLSFLYQVFCYKGTIYSVTIDGINYQASAVIVSKGRYYGGAFLCAPDADITKREFYILLFKKFGRLSILSYALKMALNKIPRDESVKIVKGYQVTISATTASRYQFDGDSGETLPISIELSNQTISILHST